MHKTIYMQTNYNNKLACNVFIHIDQAPKASLPESTVRETTIEIRTADNSHPPVNVQLVDICRIQLSEVRDAFAYPSHGLDGFEYYSWFLQQNPDAAPETKMAVYFYKKI